jgi:hypothetical protein
MEENGWKIGAIFLRYPERVSGFPEKSLYPK